MEDCKYQEVVDASGSDSRNNPSWKPFLKQLFICSGAWSSIFLFGLCIGAPTVYIPQIRKEANSTTVITDEMASWLTSMYSFSAFPFIIVVATVSRFFGRKKTFIIAVTISLAGCVLLYFSTNVVHILISVMMQGVFSASQIVVLVMIITEYTSPRYRGIFLTVKSATVFWGVWVSNTIGTFFHWRMIPLFGMICAVYSLLTVVIWPESPVWLASKGKFEECTAAHRWIKGCNEESERELNDLIQSQREYLDNHDFRERSLKEHIKDFFKIIKEKEFYKPTLLALITGSLSVFSGKLMCALYALDILKKITNSESSAYVGMLILDGVTVFSMYLGCTLAKYVKRRPLLLVTSLIGAILLFVLSFYLYFIQLELIEENKYVSIFLMAIFSVAVSCGPLIVSTTVCGELIPIKSRNLSLCLVALGGKTMIASSLKTAPFLFKLLGLHGVFLMYGIIVIFVVTILFKYLPETKDRTLQQISNIIQGVKEKDNKSVLLKVNTELINS